MLFPFQELAGSIWNGTPLISLGATTITSSPFSVQPFGRFVIDKSIIATSLPVFSIHAVGQD